MIRLNDKAMLDTGYWILDARYWPLVRSLHLGEILDTEGCHIWFFQDLESSIQYHLFIGRKYFISQK